MKLSWSPSDRSFACAKALVALPEQRLPGLCGLDHDLLVHVVHLHGVQHVEVRHREVLEEPAKVVVLVAQAEEVQQQLADRGADHVRGVVVLGERPREQREANEVLVTRAYLARVEEERQEVRVLAELVVEAPEVVDPVVQQLAVAQVEPVSEQSGQRAVGQDRGWSLGSYRCSPSSGLCLSR